MSNHIYLRKRYKYAGDIMQALLDLEWDLETATSFLDRIKDADVVEVKHGKFELYGNDDDLSGSYFCSLCGWNLDEDEYLNNFSHFKYCPNCGAKMDGERRENGDK